MDVPIRPPSGWGKDGLSEFLESAHRNRLASFANKRDWYQLLLAIDQCFLKVGSGWINPHNVVAAILFFQSYARYRCACEHALAGQIGETFVAIRSLIESAGYALHIHRNVGHDEIWLGRHVDEASRKKAKDNFTIAKVRDSIRAADRMGVVIFNELYDRSIDFGGHPNERSVTGSMVINNVGNDKEIQFMFLHVDDLALDHAMKSAAQAGVCALSILGDVFSARFELLGVNAEIVRLKQGL